MTDPATDPRSRGLDLLPAGAWRSIDSNALAGRTLLITGATGFVGRWVLAAVARMNSMLSTPLAVRALTRGERPLEAAWLTWETAVDVSELDLKGPADLILHAALSSSATPASGDQALIETAIGGMGAVRFRAVKNRARLVVLSSGSVYGTANGVLNESSAFAELAPEDTYGRAKRDVEQMAQLPELAESCEVVTARLFTCIGHGYRAHNHLAHVSMIEDARAGRPIVLRSDGSAIRSYLFGADLAVWLLAILGSNGSDTVNVGSDEAISMLDFSRIVSRAAGRGDAGVEVRGTDPVVRPHFVPDIAHARSRYGVAPWTSVATAVTQLLGSAT